MQDHRAVPVQVRLDERHQKQVEPTIPISRRKSFGGSDVMAPRGRGELVNRRRVWVETHMLLEGRGGM